MLSIDTIKSRHFKPPSSPSYDEQVFFLDVERELVFPSFTTPWWAKYVCAFRERFRSAAIYVPSPDGKARVVYMFQIALQRPYVAVFSEHRLRPEPWPSRFDGGCQLSLSTPLNRKRYTAQPFVFRLSHEIPVAMDADLVVLTDVRFEGDSLVSPHALVPFEHYVSSFGGKLAKVKDKDGDKDHKPMLPKDVVDQIREKNPCLSDADLKMMSKDRKCNSSTKPKSHLREDVAAVLHESSGDDDDDGDAFEELAALRAKYMDDSNKEDAFYQRILGGDWTKSHYGVAGNAIGVFARGGAAMTVFCDRFVYPKMKSFYFNAYGVQGALILSKEFCRRSNFFFDRWIAGGKHFEFTYESCREYVPSASFQAEFDSWPDNSNSKAKAREISFVFPLCD